MRRSLLFLFSFVLDRGAYAVQLGLLTYFLGVSAQSDLYFVVIFVPLMIVNISSEVTMVTVMQSLSSISVQEEKSIVETRLALLFGAIYALATGLIMLVADPLVKALYASVPAHEIGDAGNLQRIAALLILFHGCSGVIGAILMHRGYSVLPALRMGLANCIAVVMSAALFVSNGGAVAFVLGAVLGSGTVFVLIAAKWLVGGDVSFRGALRGDVGNQFFGVVVNSFLNILVNFSHNFILIVERLLAARLGEGVITLVSLARAIVPIISGAAGAVAMARFVDAMTTPLKERLSKIAEISQRITWQSVLVATPLIIIVLYSGESIIGILFERGKFGAGERDIVWHIIMLFMVGAIHIATGSAAVKLFQLSHLNRELAILLYVGVFIYGVLAWVGCGFFGVDGLVLAYALSLNITITLLYGYLVVRNGVSVIRLPYMRYGATVLGTLGLIHTVRDTLAMFPVGYLGRLLIDSVLVVTVFILLGLMFNLPGIRTAMSKLHCWLQGG